MYKSQAEAVKEWLAAYRLNEELIDRKLDRLRSLRASMMGVSAQKLSDMPKGGGTRDAMAEFVIQCEALEKSIQVEIEIQEQCRRAIIDMISGLEKPEERMIIQYRYLFGYDWNDVMDRLYRQEKQYGQKIDAYRRRMYRAHEDALNKMAKGWKTDGKNG